MTFIELVRDIPSLIFLLLSMILAVWRIPFYYKQIFEDDKVAVIKPMPEYMSFKYFFIYYEYL